MEDPSVFYFLNQHFILIMVMDICFYFNCNCTKQHFHNYATYKSKAWS